MRFVLQGHSSYDKWLEITGPDQLSIRVDFDDVNPQVVLEATQRLVDVLNKHYGDEPVKVIFSEDE